MTHREAINHALELQAVDMLLALGFTKHTCAKCEGRGSFTDEFRSADAAGFKRMICPTCVGAGFTWDEPIRK